MASTSGTSSGSTAAANSAPPSCYTGAGSDDRKQRRMLSNRESARRSRMRKQKHLDDLAAQVMQIRKENGQLVAACKAVTQQYLAMEADNSVLRAQVTELASRLRSLGELMEFMDSAAGGAAVAAAAAAAATSFVDPWGFFPVNNQTVMASPADMLPFY